MATSDASDKGRLLSIERLDPSRHTIDAFACGKPELDTYLHQYVHCDNRDKTAVAYVVIDGDESSTPSNVLGYVTLNSFALTKRQARRRDQDKHLGRYDPLPAVLIGRLALDRSVQGQGLGSVLLISALETVLSLSDQLGVAVVVVHALDEDAAAFYEHQGFTRFRDEPRHRYYPLAPFAAALTAAIE